MENKVISGGGGKKILVLGPAYPYRGGIATFSERLSETFAKSGHNSEIFTFTLQYPAFIFPGKTQYSNDPPPEIKIFRLFNSINPVNWIISGLKIKQLKPDLVIWQFWMPYLAPLMGTVNRLILRNRHTKIVGILHNLHPHEPRPFDRWFTRYFVRSCHAFVCLSDSVRKELLEFNRNSKAVFIPHPVYDNFGQIAEKRVARQYLGLSQTQNIALFFGLVRPYKGLDVLIKAMADPRLSQNHHLLLLIAGEFYEPIERFLEMIAALNLEQNVKIEPRFIASEEVKYYFCAANIIVQPYRTGTQSGITQMAYHFNRPMLVTDVGGLAEIVPHNIAGYVVPPENPAAIADALDDFFTHQREEEFSKGTAQNKHRFSWKAMTNGILELTNAILPTV
ncbi:MAG: glycosyltransferase [Sphingobacteriales bacterium]|nr:MAG: glycosyltransferase [Sphingobacteriales bacterium]